MIRVNKKEIPGGSTLDTVYEILQNLKRGGPQDFEVEFNGFLLNTTQTLDEWYKLVTGLTKAECELRDEIERTTRHLRYLEEKQARYNKIDSYLQRAAVFMTEESLEQFKKYIPQSLEDLYGGMEMEAFLDVVEAIIADDDVRALLDSQGHSGMSFARVNQLVKHFYNKDIDLEKDYYS